jgi:hypothetical protein
MNQVTILCFVIKTIMVQCSAYSKMLAACLNVMLNAELDAGQNSKKSYKKLLQSC